MDFVEPLERRIHLSASGLLNPDFGSGGRAVVPIFSDNRDSANAVALQRDGRVVVAGWSVGKRDQLILSNLTLARFNVDGTADTTFGPDHTGRVLLPVQVGLFGPRARPDGLAIQKDGRIVVALDASSGVEFYRFNPDGTL